MKFYADTSLPFPFRHRTKDFGAFAGPDCETVAFFRKKEVDLGTVCAYLWRVIMNLNLRLLLNALRIRRAAVEV